MAVKTFTVTSEGKIIGETEIRDEINKIQLKKVKENGEPLPALCSAFTMPTTRSCSSRLPMTAVI